MGKLFNLKEWLTVPETARHLAGVFGEEVTEADVLRLILDGRLHLSVNFVNHTSARPGNIVCVSMEEILEADATRIYPDKLRWSDLRAQLEAQAAGVSCENNPRMTLISLRISGDKYLNLEEKISTISGVWDLAMIGSERLDVEHRYQILTNGPEITLCNLNGCFVERKDGVMCQLQTCMEDNEFQSGSKAALEQLEIKVHNLQLPDSEAQSLRAAHAEKRQEYLANRKSKDPLSDYFPAGGLPDDCVWVVRTSAIQEFEKSLEIEPVKSNKNVGARERNTFLALIAALCKTQNLDLNQPYKAAESIHLSLELIGKTLDTETIVAKLKEASDLIR